MGWFWPPLGYFKEHMVDSAPWEESTATSVLPLKSNWAELQGFKGQSAESHKNCHIFATVNDRKVRLAAACAAHKVLSTGIRLFGNTYELGSDFEWFFKMSCFFRMFFFFHFHTEDESSHGSDSPQYAAFVGPFHVQLRDFCDCAP